MTSVGFTGTQSGMTPEQASTVEAIFATVSVMAASNVTLYHGMCAGADEEAHRMVRAHFAWRIVGLPASDVAPHKQVRDLDVDHLYPARPALKRNEDVADCWLVVAAPATGEEVRRSGTWATVRLSRKERSHRVIVRPSGMAVWEWHS